MKRFEREEEAEELTGQVEVVVGAAGAGAYVEAGGSATHLPPSLPLTTVKDQLVLCAQ
jgi:hypothetical protein